VFTDDGIPDLVMDFGKFAIVVEAKTASYEHAAPSGISQTLAYPSAIARKLGRPIEDIEMIYISPDGHEAQNEKATMTTFVTFALSLASVLETEELPPDTRTAYKMVITHFLTTATTSSASVRELITRVAGWSLQPDWTDDRRILHRLHDLAEAATILLSEPKHER
jgi:hypothetical protein